jgi:hypothetical protein
MGQSHVKIENKNILFYCWQRPRTLALYRVIPGDRDCEIETQRLIWPVSYYVVGRVLENMGNRSPL